jgi:UDP-2,3-diacylglucosamine hydrolase
VKIHHSLDISNTISIKRVYFASDFHLGIPDHNSSLEREMKIVKWLEECRKDASEIFLMGDIFDFWFEYRSVVPKGYIRLLGKLAEIVDQGVPVHLFTGNHDIWAFGYLSEEVGIQLHREPEIREFWGRRFYLAHGDGLGPGDNGYKFLKKVFSNRLNQWLFRWMHPDIGAAMALYFSRKSRTANMIKEGRKETIGDIQNEMLYKYCKELIARGPDVDFFVFGHRHLPADHAIEPNKRLIILGDWLVNFSYAVFDGTDLQLKYYLPPLKPQSP